MSSGRVAGSNSRSSSRCTIICLRSSAAAGPAGGQGSLLRARSARRCRATSSSSAARAVWCARAASAAKSTAAKRLAARLGYAFLDTGALYRTLALIGRRRGVSWDDAGGLGALAERLSIGFVPQGETNRVLADGEDVTQDIRTPEISEGA